MEGRKLIHNQHKQPSQIKPIFDNRSVVPNGERLSSQNQSRQLGLGVAPHFEPSFGTRPMVDNANGLNGMNTEVSMSKFTDPKFQIQGNAGKKKTPKPSADSTNKTHSSPGPYREHDLYMPIANVVRIMRRALPTHAKVADDAKEMLQECVSEFISFVTSEANETCQQEHRKTVMAEDVIGAMAKLGFDHYVEPLMIYLQRYRESEMLPMVPRPAVVHGGNIGPGYQSAARAGAPGLMQPTNDGLLPFAVVHPQLAMFGSARDGGYYHDGSGQSTGTMSRGQDSTAIDTVHGGIGPTAHGGNVPSLALGIGGGPNGSDGGAGPSGTSQAGTGFYGPYAQYK